MSKIHKECVKHKTANFVRTDLLRKKNLFIANHKINVAEQVPSEQLSCN